MSDTTRASITSATISTASRRTSSVAGCIRGAGRTTTRGAVRRGNTTVKHGPWPGWLAAKMRPPCQSTIDLQIASPNPVPP
jgi:hypothetical protein